MNGNCTALNPAASEGRVSPCDEANSLIHLALSTHEELLDRLISRLGVALSSECKKADGAVGLQAVDNPACSELHGRLLSISARVRQHNQALSDTLDRLTL